MDIVDIMYFIKFGVGFSVCLTICRVIVDEIDFRKKVKRARKQHRMNVKMAIGCEGLKEQ